MEWLPDSLHAVTIQRNIITDDRQALRLGLRNQHTVKRIFMRTVQYPAVATLAIVYTVSIHYTSDKELPPSRHREVLSHGLESWYSAEAR